ncbi:MAG: VOC family protein [Actinomycetota bacterium]
MTEPFPALIATALDTTDPRGLAEFYRQLLGYVYRAGDEVPTDGPDEPRWLVLTDTGGQPRLAMQRVDRLPTPTWPTGEVAQQLHLDLSVENVDELHRNRDRAVALGARLLDDRSADGADPLCVLADPSGHPFCLIAPPVDR